jgi:hypothetical protein
LQGFASVDVGKATSALHLKLYGALAEVVAK